MTRTTKTTAAAPTIEEVEAEMRAEREAKQARSDRRQAETLLSVKLQEAKRSDPMWWSKLLRPQKLQVVTAAWPDCPVPKQAHSTTRCGGPAGRPVVVDTRGFYLTADGIWRTAGHYWVSSPVFPLVRPAHNQGAAYAVLTGGKWVTVETTFAQAVDPKETIKRLMAGGLVLNAAAQWTDLGFGPIPASEAKTVPHLCREVPAWEWLARFIVGHHDQVPCRERPPGLRPADEIQVIDSKWPM